MTSTNNQHSKHERAYLLIRSRIGDGTYEPGERLVIDALAGELGISPVPVREAIRRLEAEGRVVYRHNAGARVAPGDARRGLHVGIDTGRTSTDAVVMDGKTVLGAVKQPTTPDVSTGILAALEALLRETRLSPASITAVLIGTTQFARAFEERRFAPTACIRLGLPATEALPPMVDWPDELRQATGCRCYLAHGGHAYDGRPFAGIRPDELHAIAAELRHQDVRSVAISAVFSPMASSAEQQAAAVLQAALPNVVFTLSHQIGSLGLLERENGAIINACLRGHGQPVIAGLQSLLRRVGITAPLYLTQNDGTLMTADYARRFPVLTFSSGHANSMRGAGFLAGRRDGLVVDVGGTATTVGMLIDGFPREAPAPVRVGGVRTNFRMPDIHTLAVGGGSVVDGEPLDIGPSGLGAELFNEALIFGGSTRTLTDLAVAAGLTTLGDPSRVAHLRAQVQPVLDQFSCILRRAVARAGMREGDGPVILVGGSAWLAQAALAGIQTLVPAHHAVANAVGAATAPISGVVDQVVSLAGVSRQEVLAAAVSQAVGQAVAAGADPATVQVTWAEDIPLAYLPGNVTRVRVKATGTLAVEAWHGR
ncbi:MAG TPA: hydantoinase/oxoprolinase N-terminal domain-containing protein [Chloroflexota bacterium]|nr:hydantoinase/oxoprolinase N-terminal domain-containing protein [Chloroflexota bacterium]